MADATLSLPDARLRLALASVPPGRWAVGVSGGADSVALLLLAAERADLALHIVHLDHETRGGESAADAAFVAELASQLRLPLTLRRLGDVERHAVLPNTPARYRQARLALFREAVARERLDGVLLAHHADDQAETVLLRLLRGGGARSLVGMRRVTTLGGVVVRRPLLDVPATDLRQFLFARQQPWREDASNALPACQRNRVRPLLRADHALAADLLQLGASCRRLSDWLDRAAPTLAERFRVPELTALAPVVARHAVGRWLVARGAPAGSVTRRVSDRLLAMAVDAAAPARATFPGGVSVRRTRGVIWAEPRA